MQLKSWLLGIRILNILCAAMMVGFEIWYMVELLESDKGFFVKIIRLFVPAFVVQQWYDDRLLAITILTAQFKYSKVVEHFKFLQFVPGLALFNLFIASLLSFQFSTIYNQVATIIVGILFVVLSAFFGVMHCLKPAGTESLLAADD